MLLQGKVIYLFVLLSGSAIKAQLLGIEGLHVSIPGLLALGGNGKKSTEPPTTTTTTTTTTPPTPPPPTAPTKTKKPTDASCGYTQTFVNGKRSCRGKLILQENFAKLMANKWLKEIKFGGEPDYEFTIYQDNEENAYLVKNTLRIRPTLTDAKYGEGYVTGDGELNLGDECTGEPNTPQCVQKSRAWQIIAPTISGLLTTRTKLSFLYGVVEIRARLPQGDWIYPELYLKPKSNFYGPGYDSGAIRIAFTPGNINMSKILSGGVILGQSEVGRSYGMRTLDSHVRWNRDFHVFKVEWKPDVINFSVDDEVYATIDAPENGFGALEELGLDPELTEKWQRGSKLAPFDKEMYLALGVGVGGQVFPDTEDMVKPWENSNPKGPLQFYRQKDVWHSTWGDNSDLVVDYVKIWAL